MSCCYRSGRLQLVRQCSVREETAPTAIHIRSQRLCKPREGHLQVWHGADSRINSDRHLDSEHLYLRLDVCRLRATTTVVVVAQSRRTSGTLVKLLLTVCRTVCCDVTSLRYDEVTNCGSGVLQAV